jgi:NhaP-type Na+/H+ or K+/H+ antiporter
MSFLGWMALGGVVLLLMALSSAYRRNLPVSTSALYLALGAAIGPMGAGVLQIDLRAEVPWFERVTEVAPALPAWGFAPICCSVSIRERRFSRARCWRRPTRYWPTP